MAVKQETEKMTDTLQDMAETQQATFEAATDSMMSMQRRSMSFAEDGLKLMEMQQDTLRATQKWFADGVGLAQRQQKAARFAQSWMLSGFDAFQKQTEQNLNLVDSMMGNVRRQQENFQTLTGAWMSAYQSFAAPFVDQAEQNVRAMKSAANGNSRGRK